MSTGVFMIEIGGAYFPAWLLSMTGGLLLALLTRWIFLITGIESGLRPRALAYPCIGLCWVFLIQLVFFRA